MVMNILSPKCPKCGKPVDRGASFCGSCGSPLAGKSGKVCGACGAENTVEARFCAKCGRPLDSSAAPEIRQHHWARRAEDFAVRVDAVDLPGLLRRGLIVEPGTNAMFIERGVNQGIIPPGTYMLETPGQKIWDWLTTGIPEHATILLVDVTPTDLVFHLGGRFTKDPLPVGVTIRMQVDVGEPGKFLVNVLKGSERFSGEALREYLYPEVVGVADRWLRSQLLQDLAEDPLQAEKLELALEQSLKTTFAQSGLRFLQVRAVELNLEPFDKVKGIRGSTQLWLLEERARLDDAMLRAQTEDERRVFEEQRKLVLAKAEVESKKHYSDLQHELDLLGMAEETRKVEMEERRVDLYARMRAAVASDKMNEVRSEADFDRFLDDIDREKLLRERDKNEMLRAWREGDHDRDRTRAHLLAKLDVEQSYELKSLELKLRTDLDDQELTTQLAIERKRVEGMESIEFARIQMQIQHQKMVDDYQGEKKKTEELAERERRIQDSLTQATLLRNELEMQRLQVEQGMVQLERMKSIQRTDRKLTELDRLEVKQRENEIDLAKTQAQLDMDIRRMREQHAMEIEMRRQAQAEKMEALKEDHGFELSRMEEIGRMGPEQLATISGPEQGKILVELARTNAMKGMSEEQIKMMVAERSPEVAKALQEAYRAAAEGKAGEETRRLMEQLLSQKETSHQQQVEMMQDAMEKERASMQGLLQATERMHGKGLDTAAQIARDVAQASHSGQGAPVIITPGAGPQVVYPGQPGGPLPSTPQASQQADLKTCTNCGHLVPADLRFCHHCGHEFQGV
jgi:hypothetical protein